MNDPLRGPIEARLLAVERTLTGMESDLRRLDRDATELGQRIWDEASVIRAHPGMAPVPPPPNTVVHGTVIGCNGAHLPGQPVTVTLTSTGAVLFAATTDGVGGYSGSFSATSNVGVTVTVAPTSARQATTAATGTAVAGGSTAINVSPAAASGFACGACPLPVATTLTLTVTGNCPAQPIYPSDTLTYTDPLPAYAQANTGFTKGWLGATDFTIGGTHDFRHVLQGSTTSGAWTLKSASVTTSTAFGTGIPAATCATPSLAMNCTNGAFVGTITE